MLNVNNVQKLHIIKNNEGKVWKHIRKYECMNASLYITSQLQCKISQYHLISEHVKKTYNAFISLYVSSGAYWH